MIRYNYLVEIAQDNLYDFLVNYSDFYLYKQITKLNEKGDDFGVDVCLEIINHRKSMRGEIGGKYIEYQGIMHEILWRDEDDVFGIVPIVADEDMKHYIVYEIRIDGISNTNRKDSDSKGQEVCDKEGDAKGEEVQGCSNLWRSINSLWGQLLSRFSRNGKG